MANKSKGWRPGPMTPDLWKKNPQGISGMMDEMSGKGFSNTPAAPKAVPMVKLGVWQSKQPNDYNSADYLLKLALQPAIQTHLKMAFLPSSEALKIAKTAYPQYTPDADFIRARIIDLMTYIEGLGQTINKARRYLLLITWYNYILDQIVRATAMMQENGNLPETEQMEVMVNGQKYPLAELYFLYKNLLFAVYLQMCIAHGRLMVGTANGQPLWVELPAHLIGKQRITAQEWTDLSGQCFLFMDLFSGANDIQIYDRIMFPSVTRWPRWAVWGQLSQLTEEKWLKRLTTSLNYTNVKDCTEEKFESVLADILLRQNRVLVENRPVLVKLDGNRVVDTILLMRKGSIIVAKISAYEGFDFIESINLADGRFCGWLTTSDVLGSSTLQDYQYLIPMLLAQVYRDIVVAEVKTVKRVRKAHKEQTLVEMPFEGITGFGEAQGQVHWQLIPRRTYIKKTGEQDDTLIEVRSLNQKEERVKRIASSWYSVKPFSRRLPEGWKVRQSEDYRQEFLAQYSQFNITLDEHSVAVKPHGRNLAKLDEFLAGLSEQDLKELSALPHYLQRANVKRK